MEAAAAKSSTPKGGAKTAAAAGGEKNRNVAAPTKGEGVKLPAVGGTSPSPVKTTTAAAAAAAAPLLVAAASAVPAEPLSEELLGSLGALLTTYVIAEVLFELSRPVVDEEVENEKVAKKLRENGEVQLLYEMYAEQFPIVDGCITAELIDEEYCLSYVMPNCRIHLSKLPGR